MTTRNYREYLATGHAGNPAKGPIPADALTFEVQEVDGTLPSQFPFYITLGDGTDRYEVVKVIDSDKPLDSEANTFAVERGQEGTEAIEHAREAQATWHFGITNQELANLVQAGAASRGGRPRRGA